MMKSSMPIDEAADKRPIVPGTSIPFLRPDGNGDMDSGKGKYFAGNEELPMVADDAAAPTTVAIDGLVVSTIALVQVVERSCI
jgi:hypothetical protein